MDILEKDRLDRYMQNVFSAKFTKFNYQIIFEIGFFPKISVCEN